MFLVENSKQIYPIPRYYEARLRIHNEVKPSHFYWFIVDTCLFYSFFFCLFLCISLIEKLSDWFSVFSTNLPPKGDSFGEIVRDVHWPDWKIGTLMYNKHQWCSFSGRCRCLATHSIATVIADKLYVHADYC